MYIKVNDKKYKFEFDAPVCAEIIGLIFRLNYELTGKDYLMLDDLSLILFQIDITQLIKRNRVVTGEAYSFNSEGVLIGDYFRYRVSLRPLHSNNVLMPILFERGMNRFNKESVTLVNAAAIGNDNLSEHTTELTISVFNRYLRNELRDNVYNALFNTNGVVEDKGKRNYSSISLDYIIDTLSLDREAIIESLSLHNVGFNLY